MSTRNVAQARSLLFVPGNRPERFEKAVRSGADVIILDLEDSVPTQDKATARQAIASQWGSLQALDVPLVVRMNQETSSAWSDDLTLLKNLPNLAAVMVPKVESAHTLAQLSEHIAGLALLPLIESAAGYLHLNDIAKASHVIRLVVGHIDFMADTGISCDADEVELNPLRFAVAMATRLATLAPAVDGVTVQTKDTERLRTDTLRARRFGFGGKLCIHPQQIDTVHAAFAPSQEELEWAQRVVAADAASGGAAVQLDGRMVDLPVVLKARRTLAQGSK